jgi:hypothetical protein
MTRKNPQYMNPEDEHEMWKLYWDIYLEEREIQTKEEYAIFHYIDWKFWHWEKFSLKDKKT